MVNFSVAVHLIKISLKKYFVLNNCNFKRYFTNNFKWLKRIVFPAPRGLLLDRGITIGAAVSRVHRAVPLILEDAENGLSVRMLRTIAELYGLFNDSGRRINFFDKEIDAVFRQSEACQWIAKGAKFKNSRHFAAWLGVVLQQHSSGDRQV